MKYLKEKRVLAALALMLISFHTLSASFNCQKASTALEKAICADAQLSFADEFMGNQYFAKKASFEASKSGDFTASHRRWLKDRKQACPKSDTRCLLEQYTAYSKQLSDELPALWRKHKDNRYTWWASFPPLIFAVTGEVVSNAPQFDGLFDGARAKPANKAFYQDQRFSFNIDSIRIYNDFQLTQTLDEVKSETYVASYSTAPIELSDYNFDGHKDMAALEFLPAGANVPMIYWLFQPKDKQFVYSKTLSAITSAEFLKDEKRIASTWRSSCCHHGLDIYSVTNGAVSKLYQKSFNCDPVAGECVYTLTKWVDESPIVIKTQSGLREDFDWLKAAVDLEDGGE